MSKIRINELARVLEVKPHKIIELLPLLGVDDKKTHSSSLDDEVALMVRRHFDVAENRAAARMSSDSDPDHDEHEHEPTHADDEGNDLHPPSTATATEPHSPSIAAEVRREEPAAEAVEAAAPPPPAPEPRAPIRPPLRPPIAGMRPTIVPAAPPPPPIPIPQTAPPPAPKPVVTAAPAVSAEKPAASPPVVRIHPMTPSSATPAPGPSRPAPIPAKPLPAPRPGQILSGPRAPFPAGAPPAPSATPGLAPNRPIAPPRPPQLGAPGFPRPSAPQQQRPPHQQSQRSPQLQSTVAPGPPKPQVTKPGGLVGQPTARPIVPPRADIAARILQQKAAPAMPAAPRPGVPQPRVTPGAPTPGQPIYQGRGIRPGQPPMQSRPGGPPPPGGMRPGTRGRPMHPTSAMRGLEPPPPIPVTDTHRHPAKKKTQVDLEREREEREGKLLQLRQRREEKVFASNTDITISEGITVKELSEKLGVKTNIVIKKLFEMKIYATINQTLDTKMAEQLAREFGAVVNKVSYEEEKSQEIELAEADTDLQARAPVVTIMGHVDHGKTSLLDAIRLTSVADREAGGITQHIGAYRIEKNGKKIVFIDTPGHEAFTRMRARGAKVTDIVILVVSADDGVMPQTLEAIDHAKAAKVPMIVAINKIDKPDANPERVMQQLADRGVLAEAWGGDVVMVPVSARAKTNLDLLLEMILLVTEIQNLRANPNRPAVGNVLEAKLDRGRGPVATVLIQNGSLNVGDYFICGSVFGRVRAMYDDRGNQVRTADPSMPVEVLGLESLPEVGDTFQAVTDTAKAKQIVMYRESKSREVAMAKTNKMTLEKLHAQMREGEIKDLNLIIKTDVGGTAEVLTDSLQKLSSDKVRIRVIHSGVGAITETDVLLATASEAIIVGFNVRPEKTAQEVADREKVEIRLHRIIYELQDEIKKAMAGLLDPVFKEVYKGRAEVRETFHISKIGTVAGCYVNDGSIPRSADVRLMRDNKVVYTGKISALKRFKDDASEVKYGFECGISIAGYNDIKQGDFIEAFVTEKIAAVL